MEESKETTNAVLKEMIIGLTKITDDRLLNLKEGISEVKLLMQGFVTRTELEETKRDFNASIKRIESGFAQHNEDDRISFGGLDKGQRELRDTIRTWGGAITVIAFTLPFIVPLVLRLIFKI